MRKGLKTMANNKQNQNTESGAMNAGNTGTSESASTSNAPKNTAAGAHNTAPGTIAGSTPNSINETSSTGITNAQATGSEAGGATGTVKALYNKAKDSAVGETAGKVYEQAKDKAATVLDDKKTTLASGLTSVADSLRQVGNSAQAPGEQNQVTDLAAKYTDSLANQVEKFSHYLENRDLNQMLRDVESYARRNPALFVGGAFALGFLAARFLKSSNPNQALMRRPRTEDLAFGGTGDTARRNLKGDNKSSRNRGNIGTTDTNTVKQPS
jgi:ElaB/YqjD/DUF883 family membrane-anchored ribosome-binding protein